jgi:hypothetical protein
VNYLMLLIGLVLPTVSLAQDCGKMPDSEERLACYDRLGHCVTIESKQSRLACFDRVAGDADSSAWARSVREDDESGAGSVEITEDFIDPVDNQIHKDDEAFPIRSTVETKKSPVPEIHSRITSVGASARGFTLLDLENQQLWRLKEKSPFRFEKGQQVMIVRGFLGSTVLIDVASGKRFKVKRER